MGLAILLAAGAAVLPARPVAANTSMPYFTPVHMVEQAERVLEVRLGAARDGRVPVEVLRALKGGPPARGLTIDLTKAAGPEHARDFERRLAQAGATPAVLFMGRFREWAGEPGEEDLPLDGEDGPIQPVLLHMNGEWFGLHPRAGGALEFFAMNEHMLYTWHGGTDMLLKATEYILKVPVPDVPVRAGAVWVRHEKIGRVAGKSCGLGAVDLAGDGRMFLFVASEAGDRLYAFDAKAKKHRDVTAARKLGSRSNCAAWGDFSGDGRLDLASWNRDEELTLHVQGADGSFQRRKSRTTVALPNDVVSLTALDVGSGRGAGILVGSLDAPKLLFPKDTGWWELKYLSALKKEDFARIGDQAYPCLVADFDGDAVADFIQPHEKGGAFYKGKGAGAFEKARVCAVALGRGGGRATLGDFDQDGKLDVLASNRDGNFHLWSNRGGGKFVDTWPDTGEPTYIAQRQNAPIAVCAGDVNSDGREDFLVLYAPTEDEYERRYPYLFFNRGFRCFGHAHMLDIDEHQDDLDDIAREAERGARAGLLADLDGDGRQEMILVLAGGGLWVLKPAIADGNLEPLGNPPLALAVALPPGLAGPVTVTARNEEEERPLGARLVAAGGAASFGLPEPSVVTVEWRLPGGRPGKKKLVVVDGPVRFVLPASE